VSPCSPIAAASRQGDVDQDQLALGPRGDLDALLVGDLSRVARLHLLAVDLHAPVDDVQVDSAAGPERMLHRGSRREP
jgi:hypothetical protein